MDCIIIDSIVMPRTRSLELGGEAVCVETSMASGKLVRDVVGWRMTLTASWEWLPQETMAALVGLTRSGRFVTIQYPDPVNGTAAGQFGITIGKQKVFRFRDGEPCWYNVELEATAQEVEPYAADQ